MCSVIRSRACQKLCIRVIAPACGLQVCGKTAVSPDKVKERAENKLGKVVGNKR